MGIMTKLVNNVDSLEELKKLDIRRLLTTQKLLIEDLMFWINNSNDKNLLYDSIETIKLCSDLMIKKVNKVYKNGKI